MSMDKPGSSVVGKAHQHSTSLEELVVVTGVTQQYLRLDHIQRLIWSLNGQVEVCSN